MAQGCKSEQTKGKADFPFAWALSDSGQWPAHQSAHFLYTNGSLCSHSLRSEWLTDGRCGSRPLVRPKRWSPHNPDSTEPAHVSLSARTPYQPVHQHHVHAVAQSCGETFQASGARSKQPVSPKQRCYHTPQTTSRVQPCFFVMVVYNLVHTSDNGLHHRRRNRTVRQLRRSAVCAEPLQTDDQHQELIIPRQGHDDRQTMQRAATSC